MTTLPYHPAELPHDAGNICLFAYMRQSRAPLPGNDISMAFIYCRNICVFKEDCRIHVRLWVSIGFNQQITRLISSDPRVMNPTCPGSDTQRKTKRQMYDIEQ